LSAARLASESAVAAHHSGARRVRNRAGRRTGAALARPCDRQRRRSRQPSSELATACRKASRRSGTTSGTTTCSQTTRWWVASSCPPPRRKGGSGCGLWPTAATRTPRRRTATRRRARPRWRFREELAAGVRHLSFWRYSRKVDQSAGLTWSVANETPSRPKLPVRRTVRFQ
jgi:hypothetical protein